MKIVWGILILCTIVVSHELGHFLVAKLNGIEVKEFDIGFGPKIFGFKKGGTEYCLRALPLGGACVFDDLDNVDEDLDMAAIIERSSYRKANVWARIATTLAGPCFNFLLAFILGLFMMNHVDMPTTLITSITEDGVAADAGLQVGDRITKINHSKVYLYPEVSMAIQLGYGEPLTVTYERDNKKYVTTMVPKMNDEYGYYMIGVGFGGGDVVDTSATSIIKNSYLYVRYMVKMTFTSLRMLFNGQAAVSDLSGPVGAVEIVSEEYDSASQMGPLAVLVSMLNIALLLSANLGVVNLLPIPALDGGKLVLLLVEAVRGKPVDAKMEGIIQFVGVVLLLLLMVVVMYNDIARLFIK